MSHPPFARRQSLTGSAAPGAGALGLGGCAPTAGTPVQGLDGARPIATVAQGQLRGVPDGQVLSFKRMPYAANPVTAANRFKAAQAAPTWAGVREANRDGPMPPQPSRAPGGGMAGEADDLTRNLLAPAGVRHAPVMVWFPGGAYCRVDASEGWYGGSSFAANGIVVVTVNCRVGIDGFMAVEGMPHNRGLLDSVAALEWVQQNIAAFGGHAGDVTIAGQSAGAQSVLLRMGMPMAQGLFHKAIAQSPPQNRFTPEQARRVALATAEVLGVAPTAAALAEAPLHLVPGGTIDKIPAPAVAAGAPVWLDNFAWQSPGFGGRLGAGHVVDVPFGFNTLSAKQAAPFLGGPGDPALATRMHAHWTRCVRTGDTGWAGCDLARRPTMRLDSRSALVNDPLSERRQLWAGAAFN